MFDKEHSLVLNNRPSHHGLMTTNNTTTRTRRLRGSVRTIWQESVAAHRAMLRLTPYFDEHRDDGR
jgi:hypothetical protein